MSNRVLIVDDNATIRSLASKVVESLGLQPTVAKDGQQGYELAAEQSFQLILSDINMPKMDGIEMISKVRKLPSYARTPILIITTESSDDMIQKGKQAGANGWMTKPFQREKLVDMLKRLSNS
ncbi:MAG: response regulator [Myxococcota bacterium]